MKNKISRNQGTKDVSSKPHQPFITSNAAIIFFFFILSVIFTYPLITHLDSSIPAYTLYDPPLYVWNSWNFEKALLTPPHNPFISPYLLYPFEPSVAYHDYTTVRNILILALSPFISRIAAFNLITLLMFTFSAYGAYLLTLRFVKNRFAAFLSGFIFSFCPFKVGRLLGHFNFIDSAFIPFFILFLYKTFENRKPKNAILTGVFLALVGYCSYYYLVFCVIFTLFFLLYYLSPDIKTFVSSRQVSKRVRSFLDSTTKILVIPVLFVVIYLFFIGYIYPPPMKITRLNRPMLLLLFIVLLNFFVRYKFNGKIFAGGLKNNIINTFGGKSFAMWVVSVAVFLILFAPIIIPVFSLNDDYMGKDVTNFKVQNYPGFEDFFRLSGLSTIKRSLTGRFEMNLETTISVGWIVLMLIIYSVIFTRKKTNIKFWYLTGGFFALFSLGHTLKVQDRPLLWMPYKILQSIPFLKGAINPSRYIIITMLAAGIISAFSTEHIFHWLKRTERKLKIRKLAAVSAILIFVFIAAEYSTVPIFISDLTPDPFYNKISNDKEDYTILELPFLIVGKARWMGGWVERWGLYQYYQAVHGKNLMGGYLSYIPRDVITYYSKNPFMKDIEILQDGSRPPEEKHEIIRRNKQFQTKRFADLFNIRYIVIHDEDLKNNSDVFLKEYLRRCLPDMRQAYKDRSITVYALTPSRINTFYNKNLLRANNDMIFVRGWSDFDETDSPVGRYITAKRARIIFPSEKPTDIILKISIEANKKMNDEDVHLSFYLNKNYISRLILLSASSKDAASHFEIKLPKGLMKKGSNLLDIQTDSGFKPETIKVKNLEFD